LNKHTTMTQILYVGLDVHKDSAVAPEGRDGAQLIGIAFVTLAFVGVDGAQLARIGSEDVVTEVFEETTDNMNSLSGRFGHLLNIEGFLDR
ncbi:MAG: hypothetical protein KDN22_22590, partial [Verrucomicrobiae bacterium]|nr:hypothetical protein [Verrucomicrobiae bacterium]